MTSFEAFRQASITPWLNGRGSAPFATGRLIDAENDLMSYGGEGLATRQNSRISQRQPPSSAGNSLPQCRVVIQYIFSHGYRLNGTEQYPCRPQIIGFHSQIDDLAHGGIAHQVVGNLDGDLHGRLGGAFVVRNRICFCLRGRQSRQLSPRCRRRNGRCRVFYVPPGYRQSATGFLRPKLPCAHPC